MKKKSLRVIIAALAITVVSWSICGCGSNKGTENH